MSKFPFSHITWIAGAKNNPGLENNAWFVPCSAIVFFPSYGEMGEENNSIILKDKTNVVQLYASHKSGLFKSIAQGEVDSRACSISVEFFQPGARQFSINFASSCVNTAGVLFVRSANNDYWTIGSPSHPCYLSPNFTTGKIGDQRRGTTYTVEAHSKYILHKYFGILPTGELPNPYSPYRDGTFAFWVDFDCALTDDFETLASYDDFECAITDDFESLAFYELFSCAHTEDHEVIATYDSHGCAYALQVIEATWDTLSCALAPQTNVATWQDYECALRFSYIIPDGNAINTSAHARWDDSGDSNIYGTNNFGLSLYPGGIRGSADVSFAFVGVIGRFWCSDEHSSSHGKWFELNHFENSWTAFQIASSAKWGGHSVKAVKDYDGNWPDGHVLHEQYTDGSGTKYSAVVIAGKLWTVSNLKTTKYQNGDDINHVEVDSFWDIWPNGAYCWYNNDYSTYGHAYGALYNWLAIDNGLVSGDGWRVTTVQDWNDLLNYLINTEWDNDSITGSNVFQFLKGEKQVNHPLDQ